MTGMHPVVGVAGVTTTFWRTHGLPASLPEAAGHPKEAQLATVRRAAKLQLMWGQLCFASGGRRITALGVPPLASCPGVLQGCPKTFVAAQNGDDGDGQTTAMSHRIYHIVRC